jgi:hypothetical protein
MTEKPAEELVTDGVELSKAELAWIRAQAKKAAELKHGRSKYIPHQGLRERARRVRRREV